MSEENLDLLAEGPPIGNLLLQASTDIPPVDYGVSFAKMFLTLTALIVLFGVTAWFIRRLIRQKLERGSGQQLIQILEKKMISPKTMLYVVELEGQKILLAESHLEVRNLATSKSEARQDLR